MEPWDMAGILDRTGLYSGLLVLKAPAWSFTYEVQMFGGGEVTGGIPDEGIVEKFDFDYAFDMAGRLELYPSMMAQVSTIGIEAGWAQGDDGSTTERLRAMPFRSAHLITLTTFSSSTSFRLFTT